MTGSSALPGTGEFKPAVPEAIINRAPFTLKHLDLRDKSVSGFEW